MSATTRRPARPRRFALPAVSLPSPRAALRPAALIPAAVVLVAALVMLVAAVLGVRVFTIVSPSMARTAPVGSVVVTVPASTYGVGDIVTFNQNGRVYTHRISTSTHGAYTTRGDLNAIDDPWTLHHGDIIGTAIWHAPGWGWLLSALPWAGLGLIVIISFSKVRKLPPSWRWPIRIVGGSILFGALMVWLRPWLDVDMLGYTPASDGGILMRVVNTGLFNVNVHGTVISSGQDAVVHLSHPGQHGRYTLAPTAALSTGQRIAATILAVAPLTAALVASWRPASRHATASAPRRAPRLAFVGLATVVVTLAVVGQSLTLASLTASISNTTTTSGTGNWDSCRLSVAGSSKAYLAYAMGTTGSLSETDLTGHGYTGTWSATTTLYTTSVGCQGDTPKAAVTFDGSTQCLLPPNSSAEYPPSSISLEVWFRTTSATPARMLGLSGIPTMSNGSYDRLLYIDENGRIVFGTHGSGKQYTKSPSGTSYADGNWHHVVATLSSTAGTAIYVDGLKVASSSTITSGDNSGGIWKVGCGDLSGWSDANGNGMSSSSYFTGQLQYAAVYHTALTAAQVTAHYVAGIGIGSTCRSAIAKPGNLFLGYAMGTSSTSETDLSSNGYAGSYLTTPNLYSISLGCPGDAPRAAVNFDGSSQCLESPSASVVTNPSTFSLEAWFRTTSTTPARLLGFSKTYDLPEYSFDRVLYIDDTGRLVFGTHPSAFNYLSSPAGVDYRDGNWHQVVATLSSSGSVLYIDGNQVATNATFTGGQNMSGHWRVGCGNLQYWADAAGNSQPYSSYFTGQIQYAAVYNTALTPTQVFTQYQSANP